MEICNHRWPARAASLFCLAVILLSNTDAQSQLPAFPGAQGFGRFATGGRGGSVYHVTTLNDSGPGSFRDAVSQPNRTIVFDVAGVIDYQPPRYNVSHHITIAGQSAPGDGVVLYGDGIGYSSADNTITRFMRFRMGHSAVGEDTIGIADGHDMIFDHIAASWSLDEVFSISGSSQDPTNITIQSSIIAQGLQDHSAGGLIQTDGGVSILRCLYIDNGTRNPKVKGVNEYVNNVVYDWGVDAYILGDSAGQSYANVINNYFINGPESGNDDAFSRGNLNFHLYAANNWQDKNRNGVLDGVLLAPTDYDVNDWQASPFPYPIAVSNALPTLTAVKLVVSDVGPSWRRDTVDEQLITELTSWGTLGQTIFTEFDAPMNGPGPFHGGVVPLDSDQDGMPDYWESGMGTSTNAANNNDPSPGGSGYTRLEDYLNWLADPHGVALMNTPVEIDLRQFTRGFTNTSPVYSVANVTNGTVTLNGHIARFVPTFGFIGKAGFTFAVIDSQSSALSRPMNLFFTPQPPAFARVWRGDGTVNNWNTADDHNWSDEQSLLYPFQTGDSVIFDDTGYNTPAVNLIGSLQPAAVTVNSSQNYNFAGNGSLDGAMALNKSGSGRLTIDATNGFTGATTVSNGTLFVHGELSQSAVTVSATGTVGGRGLLGNGLTIQAGGTIAPGSGIGSPGTLTIAGTLVEPGGVIHRFDLSDDPTGSVKTNDQIQVIGNLNLAGSNSVAVNLLDGVPGDGTYVLVTYTGSLIGSIANLNVVGAQGTLTNLPGAIALIVSSVRPPVDLVWAGNGVGNIWDVGTNSNWLNAGVPDRFYFLDRVTFDNTGSTTPAVNLVGTLEPESVIVNASVNYTFGGSGKISGTTGLLKTNSGTLTVSTANDFTGVTTIAGGTLAVSQLANGSLPSGIGAASSNSTNLVLRGGTLRYLGGNVTTDRGATLNTGGGTFDIASGAASLTLSGILIGSGGLNKAGAGRLELDAVNTFSGGTVVNAGDIRMVNIAAFGSGSVTLNGTLNSVNFRFGSDVQTLGNPLVISGTNNFILLRGNNTLSQISGSGTFQGGLVDTGSTLTFEGGMSGFSGVVRAGTIPNLRFNPSTGSSSATFDLGTGSCKLNNRNGGLTANVGALIGGANTILEGASSANSVTTYVIGGKNLDTTFAGRIQEVIPARTVIIVKTGSGTLALTGASTYTGGTTVNGGTLLVNNSSGSGTGTNAVTVNSGGRLGGLGFILGPVTINNGGTLVPGNNIGTGTLTLRSNLTLNASAQMNFDLGTVAVSDRVVVGGNLALGGTLNITNAPGFGAGTYTLITYVGALSGTLPTIGAKPAGFSYSVNTSVAGQVRLIVQAQTPPSFNNVALAGGNVIFSGTGGPTNGDYYVLVSTNLLAPFNVWTRIATNQFNASGNFSFSNSVDVARPQQFYRLLLP